MSDSRGPAAVPPPDPRVKHARDALRYWDTGNWADAPAALTVPMAGHLAAALRVLLEVTDEMGAALRAAEHGDGDR